MALRLICSTWESFIPNSKKVSHRNLLKLNCACALGRFNLLKTLHWKGGWKFILIRGIDHFLVGLKGFDPFLTPKIEHQACLSREKLHVPSHFEMFPLSWNMCTTNHEYKLCYNKMYDCHLNRNKKNNYRWLAHY